MLTKLVRKVMLLELIAKFKGEGNTWDETREILEEKGYTLDVGRFWFRNLLLARYLGIAI